MTAQPTRAPLSRGRVLEAAMSVADTDGLQSVTMRRVAAALDVEAMSLYHHVRGKESLLDGLIEALITEIESAVNARYQPGDEWRTSLRQRCLTAREVMVRHRWAPELIGSRTSVPPNLIAYFEAILKTLIDGGFSYHLAHKAIHALGSMALGFSQELFKPGADDASAGDDTEAEIAAMAQVFPHLAAMVTSEVHDNTEDPLGWCDSQAEFEFTLDLILDGLGRHLTSE
jgi:AcrR family transcriptional regulator